MNSVYPAARDNEEASEDEEVIRIDEICQDNYGCKDENCGYLHEIDEDNWDEKDGWCWENAKFERECRLTSRKREETRLYEEKILEDLLKQKLKAGMKCNMCGKIVYPREDPGFRKLYCKNDYDSCWPDALISITYPKSSFIFGHSK